MCRAQMIVRTQTCRATRALPCAFLKPRGWANAVAAQGSLPCRTAGRWDAQPVCCVATLVPRRAATAPSLPAPAGPRLAGPTVGLAPLAGAPLQAAELLGLFNALLRLGHAHHSVNDPKCNTVRLRHPCRSCKAAKRCAAASHQQQANWAAGCEVTVASQRPRRLGASGSVTLDLQRWCSTQEWILCADTDQLGPSAACSWLTRSSRCSQEIGVGGDHQTPIACIVVHTLSEDNCRLCAQADHQMCCVPMSNRGCRAAAAAVTL